MLPEGLLRRPRYCEYTGLYYCHACHSNKECLVPARVLQRFDTQLYRVCDAAAEFLESINQEPLFDLSAINPKLYSKAKTLQRIKQVRSRLYHMNDFVRTCRDRRALLALIFPRLYLLETADVFSLRDLKEAENGKLYKKLYRVCQEYTTHIEKCELCQAKGFFCEYCHSPEPIFTFQIRTTIQCQNCMSCFHRKCYKVENCPKCLRIARRRVGNGSFPS